MDVRVFTTITEISIPGIEGDHSALIEQGESAGRTSVVFMDLG
jgi:hypothetical protein